MNGSGFPMRFADLDGTAIDVFQQATHLVNENGLKYPRAIDVMLENALGPKGYYGAFGTHYDYRGDGFPEMLVKSAKAHHVPLVSAEQLLSWTDARDGSRFDSLAWDGSRLSFVVRSGPGAPQLSAMLPTDWNGVTLRSISLKNGSSVSFTAETIKSVRYAFFPALSGEYSAVYLK